MFRSSNLLIILAIILSACQGPSIIFESPSGAVLYQDDFSDSSSGWENFHDPEKGTMDYFDSFYRVQVLGEYQMLTTGPGLDFADVKLASDMLKVVGTSNDIFGLVCRMEDQDNYYFFVISSDGYYGIGKVIDGVQTMLGATGMLPSEIISKGMTKNHLQADCIDEKLVLSINGQELVSTEDGEIGTGDVGIIVGTMQDSENVVLFDNFSVINP
jgi:hypothetical protein